MGRMVMRHVAMKHVTMRRLAGWCGVGLAVACLGFIAPAWPQAADSALDAVTDHEQSVPPPAVETEPSAPTFQLDGFAPTDIPPEAANIDARFSEVVVEGSTVFDPSDFEPIISRVRNRTVKLSEMFMVAQELTAFYREQGYILSMVMIEPQEIDPEGTFHFSAVEGYIGSYEFINDTEIVTTAMHRLFEDILAEQPIRLSVLERKLLLMNDLYGVSAQASLEPGDNGVGSSHLVVDIQRKRYKAGVSMGNDGNRYAGKARGSVFGETGNVLGLDESYRVTLQRGRRKNELEGYTGSFSMPLHHDGVDLIVSGGRSFVTLGGPSRALKVRGLSESLQGAVRTKVIRSRERNLTLTGSIDYTRTMTTINEALPQGDRLQRAALTMNYNSVDRFGGQALVLQLRKGLGLSDAPDSQLTRPFGRSNALVHTGTAVRENLTPVPGVTLYGLVNWQHAFDHVLSSDEYAAGGTGLGRGYDSSDITGEHGAGLRTEIRYLERFSQDKALLDNLQSWQVFGFHDLAVAYDKDRNDGRGSRQQNLRSAGFGVRFEIMEDSFLSFTFAKPLASGSARHNGGKPDERYLWELNTQF